MNSHLRNCRSRHQLFRMVANGLRDGCPHFGGTEAHDGIGDEVMHEDNHRCWKCRFDIDAILLLDRKDIDILECGKCTEGADWTPGEFSDDSECEW